MMKNVLIAESGGTKTDWCLIQNGQVSQRVTSFSLHPSNWSATFFERLESFLNRTFPAFENTIMLYSSGCHSKVNRGKLSCELKKMGFEAHVQSDLMAAGISTLKKRSGNVAILGTGSVLFTFQKGEVDAIVGGLGYEIGDEGSGYYFGKLLLEKWKSGSLSSENMEIVNAELNLSELEINRGEEKMILASFSEKLKDFKVEFSDLHAENFSIFCKTHLIDMNVDELNVVGSYGFHHQKLLERILSDFHVKLGKVVERPIEEFIEQTVSFDD